MPELPEVETIRLQLEKYLIGHKILDVEVKNPKLFEGDSKKLVGGKVIGARRFGKVLAIDFDNNYSLVIHVKMTGQLIYKGPNLEDGKTLSKKVAGGVPGSHTHFIIDFDNTGFLYYNDVRRFGWLKVVQSTKVLNIPFVAKLGPEPFKNLSFEIFSKILEKSKKKIKIILMEQDKLSGVGNIYANDALWLAAIHPETPANKLNAEQQEKLYKAIIEVLETGIKYGGASEFAYVTPDGGEGNYQKHFLIYGQEEKLCERCKIAKISKYFLGGRGTYICPNCQKLP